MMPQIVHGAQICARLLSYLVVQNKSPRITMVTAPICAIQYLHICACTFTPMCNQGYNVVKLHIPVFDVRMVGDAYDASNTLFHYHILMTGYKQCVPQLFPRGGPVSVGVRSPFSKRKQVAGHTGYKVLLHHPLNHASNHNSCSIQMILKNIYLYPNPIIIRRKSLSNSRPTHQKNRVINIGK